ncbi:AraC family transcriptional regulator [Pseudonocardia sp. TMWB2A]|uniref:AraC family transcriptional regulator n=1 Tax=Pseudonocardia sp. TMWB2A TaxID=687430 RepID=UPI00307D1F72
MTATATATAHRVRLSSHDVDETREIVGQDFCPHDLRLVERSTPLAARYRSDRVGGVGVCRLDYGAPVRIAAGAERDFYLVEIPLGGRSEVTVGADRVVADPRSGVVISPGDALAVSRSAASPQLIVRFERAAVERELAALTGLPAVRPLRFAAPLDLGSAAGRSWRRLVELLWAEIRDDGPLLASPLALVHLQSVLLGQLLAGHAHNYSQALHDDTRRPLPKLVRRAVELIDRHADEPLTVADVAEAVGVGVRALQDGFRTHVGASPTEYLRSVRLDRVHAELAAADPAASTVTDVALRWGFTHLGRFAAEYRRRHGESPSATLRG